MDRQAYMQSYWPDYRKRKKIIRFWVSSETEAELKRLALAEDKRPAVIARELMETSLKGEARLPRQLADELAELNRLLKNVANNINQQTRYAHEHRMPADPVAMLAHLRTLHEHVESFTRRALKRDTPRQ